MQKKTRGDEENASVNVDELYKYRISKNAHHYVNVFYLKRMEIEELKVQKTEPLSEKTKYSGSFNTTNLFIMKLVQINNKSERRFYVIVMTPFLSSMHSTYYIYLLYLVIVNFFLSIGYTVKL